MNIKMDYFSFKDFVGYIKNYNDFDIKRSLFLCEFLSSMEICVDGTGMSDYYTIKDLDFLNLNVSNILKDGIII